MCLAEIFRMFIGGLLVMFLTSAHAVRVRSNVHAGCKKVMKYSYCPFQESENVLHDVASKTEEQLGCMNEFCDQEMNSGEGETSRCCKLKRAITAQLQSAKLTNGFREETLEKLRRAVLGTAPKPQGSQKGKNNTTEDKRPSGKPSSAGRSPSPLPTRPLAPPRSPLPPKIPPAAPKPPAPSPPRPSTPSTPRSPRPPPPASLASTHDSSGDARKEPACAKYCAADYHGWTHKCKWKDKCDGCPACNSPFLVPLGVELEANQCICCDVKMEDSTSDFVTQVLEYCLRVQDFKEPHTKARCAETCLHNTASPSQLQHEFILSRFIEGPKCLGKNARIDDKQSGFVQALQRGLNRIKKRFGDVASCEDSEASKRANKTMTKKLATMADSWYRKGGDESEPFLHDGSSNHDKKLEQCQGACKSDSDCETGLRCFKRSRHKEVPTCRGRGRKDLWYCYLPEDSDAPSNSEESDAGCQDNDEGVQAYLSSFGKQVKNCAKAKEHYCHDPVHGMEVRRQCAASCGCHSRSSGLLRGTSSSSSFTDDRLVRFLSDYDEGVFRRTNTIEAKLHHLIVRIGGERRLHTPFEHICGGNDFEVSPKMGTDGPSEWISFTNAGQYPKFGEDCYSAFDRGARRVTVNKFAIWKQKGITIDMSNRRKAWKWCYEGGRVSIHGKTLHLKGAKTIRPWPYKCAKSVYQRIHKTDTGSPDNAFWTVKNRRSIAKRCVDWASSAREVLVLPSPDLFWGQGGEDVQKKNRIIVQSDRDPIDRGLQCYFSPTDRCISMDSDKKSVCCCSQGCSNISCPLAIKE